MCTCRGQKCILLLVPLFSDIHTANGGCTLLKHLLPLHETEHRLAQVHLKMPSKGNRSAHWRSDKFICILTVWHWLLEHNTLRKPSVFISTALGLHCSNLYSPNIFELPSFKSYNSVHRVSEPFASEPGKIQPTNLWLALCRKENFSKC